MTIMKNKDDVRREMVLSTALSVMPESVRHAVLRFSALRRDFNSGLSEIRLRSFGY